MHIDLPSDLIEKIENLPKPAIIAISGFGGSGKTTVAEMLHEAFPSSYVVHIDDFIIKEKLTEPSWDKGTFDRDRLAAQVLKPLRDGQKASYEKLVWASNELSDPVKIPSVELVIVEGISCYHPNIADYYGLKIWVDTPMEIAKSRGHARDGSNENAQHWDLWAANDLAYQKVFHPDRVADFVIQNG